VSTLANQLAQAEREELARAIRLLLSQPLISHHTEADAFELVRRRQQPLVQWFDYYCGWRLVVEPRLGYARLVKVCSDPDPTRPALRRRSSRAPLDRRRYTLLCLAAAELLAGPVTTIGMLAQRVVQASAAEPEIPVFDPVRRGERVAYVDALKLLEHSGAVAAADGATESFIDSEDAKVLYRVDSARLIRLLAAPVAPSQLVDAHESDNRVFRDPAEIVVERRYGSAPGRDAGDGAGVISETQRNLWARHSLTRRLLDDPVVYRDDLHPVQVAYAASPTGRQILRKAAAEAGFEFEERAEGYLLADPDAIATDMKFPDDGSHAKVAALHLLDVITSASRPVPWLALHGAARQLLERFPKWAKAYRFEGGTSRLVEECVEILCAFGLTRRVREDAGDMVLALPVAYRYTINRAGLEDGAAERDPGEGR
jgi:uncharacterized protein (TIGR02678 family)